MPEPWRLPEVGFLHKNCLPELLASGRIQRKMVPRRLPVPLIFPDPTIFLDALSRCACPTWAVPFSGLATRMEELNEAEKKRELERFFDPRDGKTVASSWGSSSLTGSPWFWELPREKGADKIKGIHAGKNGEMSQRWWVSVR